MAADFELDLGSGFLDALCADEGLNFGRGVVAAAVFVTVGVGAEVLIVGEAVEIRLGETFGSAGNDVGVNHGLPFQERTARLRGRVIAVPALYAADELDCRSLNTRHGSAGHDISSLACRYRKLSQSSLPSLIERCSISVQRGQTILRWFRVYALWPHARSTRNFLSFSIFSALNAPARTSTRMIRSEGVRNFTAVPHFFASGQRPYAS